MKRIEKPINNDWIAEWYKVTEKLPEQYWDGGVWDYLWPHVLVFTENGRFIVAQYDGYRWHNTETFTEILNVEIWTYLPEVPKEYRNIYE